MGRLKIFTRAWYAQEFLRELVLIYPVYAIMIGKMGVSPLELSLLFIAWSGTALILEVPTGTLADRFPRRWVLIVGQALKASGFLLWMMFPTFAGFLAGFIAWGAGGSLRSGAAEALLHDSLHGLGRAELFVRIYGRGEAAGAAAVMLAMALGGWAAESGFTLPLALSVAAPLAAAVVTLLFIAEPPRSSGAAHHERYLTTLEAGWREARDSAALRRPILYLCTAALAYEAGEEFFGPLLDGAGFELTAVGLITALLQLSRAGGAFVADRLRTARQGSISLLYGLAGVLLATAALTQGAVPLAALALFVALAAAAKVLLQGRLQLAIAGHARATITSVVALGQGLVSLPLYLALGAIANRVSWAASFTVLAAGLIVAAAALGVGGRGRS
jgi:MFS family permease